MNTQMESPKGHSPHDQDEPLRSTLILRPAGEGHEEAECHGEKKSVLKKVKAKAMKIKDSVTGHHHHDHDHNFDDDDDGEMDTDPEVHGAHTDHRFGTGLGTGMGVGSELPTSESAHFQTLNTPTATEYIPGLEETLEHSRTDIRRPIPTTTMLGDDCRTFDSARARYVSSQEESLGHSRTDIGRRPIDSKEREYEHACFQTFDPTATKYVPGMEETLGHSRTDMGRPVGYSTGGIRMDQRGISEEIGGVLSRPLDLEEDPHAPKHGGEYRDLENYQSTVTDPTGMGAEEIGAIPILHQLDKMTIHDESGGKPRDNPTKCQEEEESVFKPSGVYGKSPPSTETMTDQEPFTGSHDQFSPEPITPETSPFVENPEHEKNLDHNQGTYTDKVSSAASMVVDKAKQATSMVTTKLAEYTGSNQEGPIGNKVVTAVQEKVSPIIEKVAEVGSTMASKVQGGPRTEPGLEPVQVAQVDKGVSVKDYIVERLKPKEEDRVLSQLITETLPLRKQKEVDSPEPVWDESGSRMASPGKGMLDKIKGAANSLFGKGVETQPVLEGSSDHDSSRSGY